MRAEKHFGTVKDNADPDKLGGLKVESKTLVDGTPLREDFIPGKFPFAGRGEGFYYLPEKGSLVEVEVEADGGRAAEDLDARWSGARYTSRDAVPAEFKSNPTKRGGIKYGLEVFLQDKARALTALISGKVRLGEEDCTHPLVRGDTYNTQLETYLTAEAAWVQAISAYLGTCQICADANVAQYEALATACTGPLVPLKVAFEALKAAWQAQSAGVTSASAAAATYLAAVNAFKAAKLTWLSTKCKTE